MASLPAASIPAETPLALADKFLEKGDPGIGRSSESPDPLENGKREPIGNGAARKNGNSKSVRDSAPPRQSEDQIMQRIIKLFERPAVKAASTNALYQFAPPYNEEIGLVPLGSASTQETKSADQTPDH